MMYRLKAASGPLTGQTFDIGDGLLLGSADGADIRDASLEPRHAEILPEGGGLLLRAEGRVEINGERVERHVLESGDEIRVETLRFVLQAPGLKPARVLEPVAPSRSGPGAVVWIAAALAAAAAATVGWWWLVGPGSGPAG